MARLSRRFVIVLTLAIMLVIAVRPAWAAGSSGGQPAREHQPGGDWRCVVVNGQVGLNIRSGPGTGYPVVGTRQPGEQIEADFASRRTGASYEWVRVRDESGEGWVIAPRLDPCPAGVTPEPDTPLPVDGGGTTQSAVPGIDRDGVLDRFEIAALARSAVLIANVQRNHLVSTGTGTITSPDGLIITNAHVVEGADLIAIGILDNLNDPPEFLYLGEVLSADPRIDVALVAITTDIEGRPLRPSSLNLAHIPVTLAAEDVYRGDTVYIFGYPGIGDNFLVVTTGSIVSVENGTIEGHRMPVWYRTDAEIAPGNSGGLVVNGNGEFVGIPTFVQTESETGGRLGGIRPAEVAFMAVMEEGQATASESGAATTTVASAVAVTYQDTWLEHGTTVDDEAGLAVHAAFTLVGWEGRDAAVVARFFHDDVASTPLTNPSAPGHYRDKGNQVLISVPILPCCDETAYSDLLLAIPYAVLGFKEPGTYPLKIQIEVVAGDESWRRTVSWEFIAYTLR